MANAGRDSNYVTTLVAQSNTGDGSLVVLWADPVTHRLLVSGSGGGGTPGGSDTQVQFNDGGAFGGASNFVFLKNSGVNVSFSQDVTIGSGNGQYPLGALLTFSVNAAGSGYIVGDVVTVSGGGGDATLTRVGGKSSFWSLTFPGDGYSTGTNIATTGGTGSGLTINILTVAPDPGSVTIHGGNFTFTGGSGIALENGNGGSFIMAAGQKTGSGVDGDFALETFGVGKFTFISIDGDMRFNINGTGNILIQPSLNGHFKLNEVASGFFGVFSFTGALGADRTYSYPDKDGTFAMLSDIPTFPSIDHSRATAQAAANTNILTHAVGAADGTFQILTNVLVTASTLHSFGVTVDYTDEGGTARTLTVPFSQITGALITAITNGTGAGAYEGVTLTIRAKASTNIVFKTAGTFTTVTYNVDTSVIQIA